MTYAGFWKRYFALLIDAVIVLIPSIAANYVIPFAGGIFFSLVYKPIFEASPMMATPGKAIMGIRVVSEAGVRLTLKQAYIRYACSFLSGFVMLIGYLMSLVTAKRQTLHDLIAETVVINEKTPELNYFDVWLSGVKDLFNRIVGDASATTVYGNTSETVQRNSESVGGVISAHEQTTDITKAIEELHKLLQSGAITQQEYDAKKHELLNKI